MSRDSSVYVRNVDKNFYVPEFDVWFQLEYGSVNEMALVKIQIGKRMLL